MSSSPIDPGFESTVPPTERGSSFKGGKVERPTDTPSGLAVKTTEHAPTPFPETVTHHSDREFETTPGQVYFTKRYIGPYLILDRLGRGSQGTVYRALQTERIHRIVALKILGPTLLIDTHRIQRLQKEAERLAQLSHGSILKVFDFGQDDDHAYVVMELVKGFSLDEVIKQRKDHLANMKPPALHWLAVLPTKAYLNEVVNTIRRATEALEVAHQTRIVHRDVKPSNLLLQSEGERQVFLSDFGLARDLEDPTVDGSRHGFVGTMPYMPPEKHRGDENVDEIRGDVFAMGATLYEACTLRRAFPVPETLPQQAWHAYLASAIPERAKHLPRDLEAVIMKAIDRNPMLRYSSAGEFAEDLKRFHAGEPVIARPLGPFRAIYRQITLKHRRALQVAGSLFLMAATIALVLGLVRFVNHWRAGQILAEARSLLTRPGLSGNLNPIEQSASLISQAQALDPNHADMDEVVTLISDGILRKIEKENDGEEIERAWHWYRIWKGLTRRSPIQIERFERGHGFRRLLLQSDKPRTRVFFHALDPKGEPVPGDPLYSQKLDNDASNGDASLLPGGYWVTATDPEGRFVEFPFVVPRGPAHVQLILPIHPRSLQECTQGMIRVGDFYLDPTETTIGRFNEYLDELKRPNLKESLSKLQMKSDSALPVINVTRDEAILFAAWRGCRLPTAEEYDQLVTNAAPIKSDPIDTLQRVRDPAVDRLPTKNGDLFGLLSNAGELTLLRYRPGIGNPSSQPRSSVWYGYPVRAGWIINFDTNQPVLVSSNRIASQMTDQRNRFVGFRCARSVSPRVSISDFQPE